MSDKNTLTIDTIATEINVSKAIKKSFLEENIKLKLALNALVTKSKSLLFLLKTNPIASNRCLTNWASMVLL